MAAQTLLTPYVQLAEAGCIVAEALEAGGTVADRAAVLLRAYNAHSGALIPLTDLRTAARLVRAVRPEDSSESVGIHARFLSSIADALWSYEAELGLADGRFALEPTPDGLLYLDENGAELLPDGDR